MISVSVLDAVLLILAGVGIGMMISGVVFGYFDYKDPKL